MVTPRNMPPAIQLTVIIYLNTVITVLITDMSNDTRGQEGGHQALYSPLGGGGSFNLCTRSRNTPMLGVMYSGFETAEFPSFKI